METELYKARSLSSCMKAAYDLYRTNIKTIFRRTWLPAVLFAVLISISMVLLYGNIYNDYTSATPFTKTHIVMMSLSGVFLLLGLIANVWFDAIIISLLNGFSMKKNLPRVIRLAILMFIIVLIVSIIASLAGVIPYMGVPKEKITEETLFASTAITAGIYLLYIIAIIPAIFSSMKFLVEPEQKVMSVIGKPYKTGWRHWGYLFMLCLLAGIIISIIYFIVSMPATIVNIAAGVDAQGVALGDASGLPGYFRPLAGFAILLASFIMIYVGAWFTMIGYYAYGHIETKEKERKERKNIITKTTTETEPDFEEIK